MSAFSVNKMDGVTTNVSTELNFLNVNYLPIILSIFISFYKFVTMVYYKFVKSKKYMNGLNGFFISWSFQMFHYFFIGGADIWFGVSVTVLSLSLIIYGIQHFSCEDLSIIMFSCISLSYMLISFKETNIKSLAIISVLPLIPYGIHILFEKTE